MFGCSFYKGCQLFTCNKLHKANSLEIMDIEWHTKIRPSAERQMNDVFFSRSVTFLQITEYNAVEHKISMTTSILQLSQYAGTVYCCLSQCVHQHNSIPRAIFIFSIYRVQLNE